MSITQSAFLVELSISLWGANKIARDATETVNTDANASTGAAKVTKNLMAGTTLRKQIADYTAACRSWHLKVSLPWSDRGPRLLPCSLFLDYKTELNTRKATFDQLVEQFLQEYPAHIQTAQYNLGALFDPADYPSVEEVRGKFAFNFLLSPVPESQDFRLDIPKQDLEEVKVAYEEAFGTRLADAMKEPWQRLHDVLSATVAKLTDGEGDEKEKRYHDTLITNATSLCSLLSHLNITGDPGLEKARREVETAMMGVDIEGVREDASVRAQTKEKLEKILSGFDW